MNANWLINMVMRRVIGRLVNRGVDAGFRAMSDKPQAAGKRVETDEERAERQRIRAMRAERRAKRNSNS